jgi:hypothetical protein
MRVSLFPHLFTAALLSTLIACQDSSNELVDRGLALASDYEDAYCALAADEACAVDEDVCPYEPFASLTACGDNVSLRFTNCPDIYEALASDEAAVQGCIDALAATTCGADGLCDADGWSLLEPDACDIISELRGRYCQGADSGL